MFVLVMLQNPILCLDVVKLLKSVHFVYFITSSVVCLCLDVVLKSLHISKFMEYFN